MRAVSLVVPLGRAAPWRSLSRVQRAPRLLQLAPRLLSDKAAPESSEVLAEPLKNQKGEVSARAVIAAPDRVFGRARRAIDRRTRTDRLCLPPFRARHR